MSGYKYEIESIEYNRKYYNVYFYDDGTITDILEFDPDEYNHGNEINLDGESNLRSYLQDIVDAYLANEEWDGRSLEGFYD